MHEINNSLARKNKDLIFQKNS